MNDRLRALALVFLKLGVTGFGGPAAHIALMEHECVTRRRWLPRQEFLDLVAAAHLIPGPNSTELAIHIGRRQAGTPGLLVAGICFILPAAIIVALLAWAYVAHGATPSALSLLHGIKPMVLAIVLHALMRLSRTALRSALSIVVAGTALAASVGGVGELTILAAAALVGLLRGSGPFRPPLSRTAALGLTVAGTWVGTLVAAPPTGAAATTTLFTLALVFLKCGALLFGSGYVLIAFLHTDLVVRLGWLTDAQLLDAVAVGQTTPGPVFTTATFAGYLVGGWPGAAIATIAIFAPAFLFVALTAPVVERMRRSHRARAILDAVVAASLGLMAAVTVTLAADAVVDWPTAAIAAIGLVVVARGLNSAVAIAAAGVAGLVLH